MQSKTLRIFSKLYRQAWTCPSGKKLRQHQRRTSSWELDGLVYLTDVIMWCDHLQRWSVGVLHPATTEEGDGMRLRPWFPKAGWTFWCHITTAGHPEIISASTRSPLKMWGRSAASHLRELYWLHVIQYYLSKVYLQYLKRWHHFKVTCEDSRQ